MNLDVTKLPDNELIDAYFAGIRFKSKEYQKEYGDIEPWTEDSEKMLDMIIEELNKRGL